MTLPHRPLSQTHTLTVTLAALALWAAGALASCATPPAPSDTPTPRADTPPPTPTEHTPRMIRLEGPCAARNVELSGAAWWGDTLVLLPQYPRRLANQAAPRGALCMLDREEVEAAALGDDPTPSLAPRLLPWDDGGLSDNEIPGFEGYEAIAFDGETVAVTVEASQPGEMVGYVAMGRLEVGGIDRVRLDPAPRARLTAQAALDNLAFEALAFTPDGLITLYEANGAQVNPTRRVVRLDRNLTPQGPRAMVKLECRLTDITAIDAKGRFWASNYCWSGETALLPKSDVLRDRFGVGPTHARLKTVERLVELAITERGVVWTDTPPLDLALLGDDAGRNWEGIVRLGDHGFILVTDKHPETLMGFVPARRAP